MMKHDLKCFSSSRTRTSINTIKGNKYVYIVKDHLINISQEEFTIEVNILEFYFHSLKVKATTLFTVKKKTTFLGHPVDQFAFT